VILGVVALGKIKRGEADGKGMAIGGIVTGALALLLTVLIVVAVGSFFAENKDELETLDDCLKNANNNQAQIQQCQNEFNRQLNP